MKTSDLPSYPKGSKPIARNLRNNMTEAEWKLWGYLRRRQLGPRFRRQFPIGTYIVDFIALKVGLVIEVDGGQHYRPGNIRKDNIRTHYLEGYGLTVIRVNNNDVRSNIEGVIEYISKNIEKLEAAS